MSNKLHFAFNKLHLTRNELHLISQKRTDTPDALYAFASLQFRDVPICKLTNSQTCKWMHFQMCRCIILQICNPAVLHIGEHANRHNYKFGKMYLLRQTCKLWNFKNCIFACWDAGECCKFVNLQIRKFSNLQICTFTNSVSL